MVFKPNAPALPYSSTPVLLSAQLRIEQIAERVAECVEGENGQKDRGGGERDDMRIAAHSAVAVLRQGAPTGAPAAVRIVDADTDKAQGGFGEDRRSDAEGERDDDRTDDIGQNVTQ